ncbi:MAG: serine/threonine protein phosphatase [Acetobacteraceae bacterium]|nr:serine/threonine protein phosphatase [Acetobacteraceae bacterium]
MNERLAPATLPPGQRIYAVGDVHGCLDQLEAMHRAIGADLRARPHADALVIHLGDYIDRGPDSAGVIARLVGPHPVDGARVVNLIGNHEDLLLGALDGRRAEAEVWLANGGHAALQSWGVPPRTPARQWAALIPPPHLAFMRELALMHRAGGYVFVHAGVRPGLALSAQTRQDLLWIREPFLSSTRTHEAVVVHGHTPEESVPVLRANRIGLDTGAVLGGPLTCAVLEADRVRFLQT